MRSRALLPLLGLGLVSLIVLDAGSVWARATGGGSRGSRSYSAPSRPAPSPVAPSNPTSPSRSSTQSAPMQPQRPSLFGGLMGGIAGFALGGLIGSMLFGGMGRGMGGGIGILEILLIAGGAFFLIRALRGRRSEPAPAYADAGASAYGAGSAGWSGGAAAEAPAVPSAPSDLERGIGFIRQMDPGFAPAAFGEWAQRAFADVQDGITRRDLSTVSDRLTPQEYARLQGQCDQLRSARQTNRVEQIQCKRVEVTEAWQESGQDWVTVYIGASLVDYTVDDSTGGLVNGSKSPQEIEEYWTFTRPVGPQPWRLSAIQTS